MTVPTPVDDTQALKGYLVECPVGFDHDAVKDLLERLDRAISADSVEAAAWYRRRLRTVRQGIEAAVREREEARAARVAGEDLVFSPAGSPVWMPREATTEEAPE
jgi:hypothetical protein